MEKLQQKLPPGSKLITGADGRIKGIACHDGSWDLSDEGRAFLANPTQRQRQLGSIVRGIVHKLCGRNK